MLFVRAAAPLARIVWISVSEGSLKNLREFYFCKYMDISKCLTSIKNGSHVILIEHFFVLPCQTAPTEQEYFNGHIFHYALGDYIFKLCKKICFK